MAKAATVALLGGLSYAAALALRRRYRSDTAGAAVRAGANEVRELAALVRQGMAQREAELRLALGLDVPPAGARLDPQAVQALLDDPARWRPQASRAGGG